jgi:hypothetical protein
MNVREPLVSVNPAISRPDHSAWDCGSGESKQSVGGPRENKDQLPIPSRSVDGHSEVWLFQRLLTYFSAGLRLGVFNVARVTVYRACKRLGIYRWLLPSRTVSPLESPVDSLGDAAQPVVTWADPSILTEADALLSGRATYFSVHARDVGCPPDWFLNPFRNQAHPQPAAHWSDIADFNGDAGDIKVVWEMSRFGWTTVFARAWRITGDKRYVTALQSWIQDWWRCNPPNTGPNWMCGQETSIRLINALLGLHIAGLENGSASGMAAFVEAHCQRVDLTTFYAVGQDNNHATSEAAGLFIGGTWLAMYGERDAKTRGKRWARKGRKLLERAIRRLVLRDGSFSQHSLTYHRLMLDTLSIAEGWRRRVGEPPFSETFHARATAATRWLGAMIDAASGDGPNLGANDGAHPYRLDSSAYRDFRPCLQLASLLFTGGPALESGPWCESAAWLGVPAQEHGRPWVNDLGSTIFPDGGYVALRDKIAVQMILRTPTARFRPGHADALHVDLWWKGKNLLRDGGSYAYAGGGMVAETLASVAGHNTHQFDGHDQMPRLGRFLYGGWVRVAGMAGIDTSADGQRWAGSYTDSWGATHKRTVVLKSDALCVLDEVKGFKRKAVLRWRLAAGNWSQNDTGCISELGQIRVESSVSIRRMSLESGSESRHYLEKSAVPVLEIEIDQSPAIVKTIVTPS